MNDAGFVRRIQRIRNLFRDVNGGDDRQARAGDAICQRLALDELEHEGRLAMVLDLVGADSGSTIPDERAQGCEVTTGLCRSTKV